MDTRPAPSPTQRRSAAARGLFGSLLLAVVLVAGAAGVALVLPAGPAELHATAHVSTGSQLR
jgi:hypothetical protein